MHPGTLGSMARKTHAGCTPGMLGSMACRTHTRGVPTMDGGWVHGEILRVHPRLFCALAWSLDVAVCQRPSIHPGRQGSRRMYANPVQTRPTPVHSRDAACPRPASLSASCAI